MGLLLLGACAGSGDDPVDGSPVDSDTGVVGEGTALAVLDVGGVALAPGFDPDQLYYSVRASDLTGSVQLDAVPVNPGASVEVLHQTVDGALVGTGISGDTWTPGPDQRFVVVVDDGLGDPQRYGVFLLPDDVPELTVETTETATPGFTFLANFDFESQPVGVGRYALVVDPLGVPVWWRRHEQPSFDLRISEGRLSYLGTETGVQGLEGLFVDPGTGETVARFVPREPAVGTLLGTDPHELFGLPGGGAVLIGTVLRTRDLSAFGGPVDGKVIDQVVQEQDASGEVVFEWSTEGVALEDLPSFFKSFVIANAPEVEVAHANAVEVDSHDGNWVISMRTVSQVVKVARQPTTWRGREYAPGERMWTLGGPASDFVFVGDDREGGWTGFSEQHTARVLEDGHLLLFDNGTSFDLGRTGAARAVEYVLDEEAMTATLVWSHTLADGGPAPAAGSVQRLASGHTLIGWGSAQDRTDGTKAPALSEVDAEGRVVRELWLPDNQWTYRAWHFEGDPLLGQW